MDTVTVPSRALVRPLYGRTNGSWDMHPGPNPLSSHDVLVVMPSRRFIQQRLLCALTLHRVTACCARSGSLFRSAWHMRSPSVASHRGAMLFPVGAFQQHLGCALACAPTLCCVASRHRLVPSRRTFQQCLAYVLAIPCAVLRHHAIRAPAPAKSTASVELASVAEGATAAELEALEHSAGVGSERGLRGVQKLPCPWASRCLMLPPSQGDTAEHACERDELGRRHR